MKINKTLARIIYKLAYNEGVTVLDIFSSFEGDISTLRIRQILSEMCSIEIFLKEYTKQSGRIIAKYFINPKYKGKLLEVAREVLKDGNARPFEVDMPKQDIPC